PSIAMLLMAVGLRLDQYGVTEPRYFLLLLSLWLAGIALYYGITGSRNIRVIPASLCFFALLTFAGPWSAYAVSRRSQANRLEGILEGNGMLDGEALHQAPAGLSYEDSKEISATVRYLIRTHGPASLAVVHASLADTTHAPTQPGTERGYTDDLAAEAVVERLGADYVSQYEARELATQSFFIAGDEAATLDIAGFDLLSRADLATSPRIAVGADTIRIQRRPSGEFEVRFRGAVIGSLPVDSLVRALRPDSRRRPDAREIPPDRRTLELAADGLRLRVVFTRISGSYDRRAGSQQLNTAYGDVLVDVR
ncbi:MAG: DUF4153 domain-containing protein, partial [Longimicrobiales bacterium]